VSDTFEIEVEVLKDLPKSLLVLTEDGEEAFIPKSEIRHGTDVESAGDEGTLIVPSWLARKEGWL